MTSLKTNFSRRVFIMQAIAVSGAVLTAQQVAAQAALAESAFELVDISCRARTHVGVGTGSRKALVLSELG